MLGTDDRSLKPLVMGKQNSGQLLDHSVWLLQRRDFIMQPRNLCLKQLVDDWLSFRCRGPIVFCGMTKVQDSACVVDIDTRDFTLALDGLAEEHKKILQSYMYRPTKKKTKGVKVTVSEPHVRDVSVPIRHPVFIKGQPSELAQLMGIGLRTLSYPSSPAQAVPSSLQLPRNLAAYFHVDVGAASPTFGSIPDSINKDSADVLVVTDSTLVDETLLPVTTEMFENYLFTVVQDGVLPVLGDSSETAQQRLRNVHRMGGMYLSAPSLAKQYGSLSAARAAQGKEWDFDADGQVVKLQEDKAE